MPPVYSPRRQRARHIKMREPARSGLFTLDEEDETQPQLRLQLELDRGVDEKNQRAKRTSWGSGETMFTLTPSTSGSGSGSSSEGDMCATPLDPFEINMDVDVDIEVRTPIDGPAYAHSGPSQHTLCASSGTLMPSLAASLSASTFRPRRPPPLNLSVITDPYASASASSSASAAGPASHGTPTKCKLLPALPLLSPEEYSARTPALDLEEMFDDLLMTCGEDVHAGIHVDSSDAESEEAGENERYRGRGMVLPLPPARSPLSPLLQTPITPPAGSKHARYPHPCPPGARGRPSRSSKPSRSHDKTTNSTSSGFGSGSGAGDGSPAGKGIGLGLRGDHSFLLSMAMDDPTLVSPSSAARCHHSRLFSPKPISSSDINIPSAPASASASAAASVAHTATSSRCSSGTTSTSRKSGSTKSKRLPTRSALPAHWTENVF